MPKKTDTSAGTPGKEPALKPLSEFNDEGFMIMPDFWALVDGERVFVTAVLERTVVYIHEGERKLVNRSKCLVDPAVIEMRPVAGTSTWRSRGKGTPAKTEAPEAVPDEPELLELDAVEGDVELDSEVDSEVDSEIEADTEAEPDTEAEGHRGQP